MVSFRKLSQYIGYLLLLFIITLFKSLGKQRSSNIASYFFCILGPLTKFQSRAKKNIKYVWPNKTDKDTKFILKKMWSNVGRNFGEFVFFRKYDPLKDISTEIYGKDTLNKIISINKKKGKGIIFFSGHYGNWELAPVVLGSLGLKILTIYRKSNNQYINNFIQTIRENFAHYTPKGDKGAKQSFLWLRKGKSLALAMDQKLNEGKVVDFLGKKSNTASAIAELSVRMDLDIVPIKIVRKEHLNFVSFCSKLEKPNKNMSHEEKVIFILEKINSTLTTWIEEKPDQWFWIHRRWDKKLYKNN